MTKKTENHSKVDFHQYLDHIEKNRSLTAIIKGHLVIESLLDELVECGLKHPDRNLIDNLKFWQKVNLCVSIGLLKPESKLAYQKLNSIRNEIAHQLDKNITRKEVVDFFNLLTDEQMAALSYWDANKMLNVYEIEVVLTDIIFSLFFEIDWELRGYGKSRLP